MMMMLLAMPLPNWSHDDQTLVVVWSLGRLFFPVWVDYFSSPVEVLSIPFGCCFCWCCCGILIVVVVTPLSSGALQHRSIVGNVDEEFDAQ